MACRVFYPSDSVLSKGIERGAFLSAGLAGTASYLYDCKFHDPDHHYLQTLLGKATVIALATVCARLAAKSLKGRAEISSLSAARFGMVEFVFAAIIAKAMQETPLQREHRQYLMDPRAWIRLEKAARTELAKTFIDAGLPALCLKQAEIDTTDFPHPQTETEWDALTPAQLSWACQIRDSEEEDSPFLYVLCLKKGVEPVSFLFDEETLAFFEGKPEATDLLYQDFVKHPHYYCAHGDHEELFGALFTGKDPLPPVEVNLDTDKVTSMDYSLLAIWGDYINEKDLWSSVSLETRTAFIKRTVLYIDYWDDEVFIEKLYVGVDSSWIAEMTMAEIQSLNQEQLQMYYDLLIANDPQLSAEQENAFKGGFQRYGIVLPPVPDTDEAWESLPSETLLLIRNTVNLSELSPRQCFNQYRCCLQKGIEPNRFAINGEVMECFKALPEATDLLYQDLVQYPFYYYCHETEDQEAMMKELFAGRDPIPQVRATLSPEEINRMNINLLVLWGDYLTQEERWTEVSPKSRSAFIKVVVYSSRDLEFPKELYAPPIDCSSLTDVNPDEVAIMSQGQLEVYHGVMDVNWGNLEKVDAELITAFNAAFTKLEWDTFLT